MNALDRFAGLDWWAVAGWTMLHYLWLGLVVGAAAAVLRFALRRASAEVRYAVALVCLVALAVLPVGIGVGVAGVGSREPGARTLSGGGIVEASAKPQAVVGAGRSEAREQGVGVEEGAKPQAVGEAVELAPAVSDGPMDTELASEAIGIEIPLSGANPRQSRGLTGVFDWNPYVESAAGWLPWVWIVGAPVTFLLLCTGVVGAERLRRESRLVVDGPVVECLERLRASLSIGRRVAVAVCERVAAPVLVGVLRPLILLPPAALSGWSPDEIEMVLLHELAHVRRWDNLVNLVQRFVEAVLFFQPAVWLVSGWVRREREACCDAVVVGATQRPQAYAELLVALAAQLPRSVLFHPAAASAMAAGPLRGRIRRILGIHDDPMLISGKSLGVVMSSLLLAATLVVLNLPGRSEAERKAGFTTEDTESTEGKAEVSFVVGASRFDEGDKIEISEVRGTKSAFEPGGTYWIEGTYTLESRDKASLSAFVTASSAGDGKTSIDEGQTMTVERGSGTFSLKLRMPYEGWPHVSFYPDGGGDGFGGVYFGTGDSVLTKWWDERERSSEDAVRLRQILEARRVKQELEAKLDEVQRTFLAIENQLRAAESDDEKKTASFLRKEHQIRQGVLLQELKNVNESLQRATARRKTEPEAEQKAELTTKGTEGKSPTAGLEESLEKKISFCVALFNAPGRGDELRELSKKFMDEGRTLYLYGYTVDPNSPAGKRFRLTGAPTCIVFQHGQETARLDMIQTREQLVQLVEAESQKPRAADGTIAKSKFPTLEEQKLADLIWRQMQIEVEPLNKEDAARVEALGYTGGVRITRERGELSASGEYGQIISGDILVGLHVWPTASRQELVDVLNRDELGEFNPLKFYVVRPDGDTRTRKSLPDKVETGRIIVGLNAKQKMKAVAAIRNSTEERVPDGTVEEEALQNRYGPPQPVLQSNLPAEPTANEPQVAGAAPSTQSGPKQQNVPDFELIPVVPLLDVEKAELVRRGPLRLQFYYSPDSAPCKRAEQLIEDYQRAYPELFEVERINVLENPAIATQRHIGHLPTMIFYQGQDQLLQATGALELEELTEFITSFARGGQLRRIEPNRKPVLRYDGKTFHQWRTEWQTELSTAKRIEAVKALAAFGRAGYGKEAAAVILDVAGEYDFTFMQNDNDANGKLKQAVVEVLSPESGRPSLAEFWLPDLLARAKDDAGKWQPLLAYAVGQLRTDDPDVIGLLRTLAEEGPAEVRGSALGALVRSERISDRTGTLSEETRQLLAAALTSDDLDQRRSALWLLVYDPNNPWALGWNGMGDARLFYLPEIVGPLLGGDQELRQRARLQLQYVQAKDAPALVEQLLKVLQDESRAAEHVEAIRAIAAMGPAGVAAKEELKKIVVEGKDEDALVAALFAVACINDKEIASLLASGNSPTSEIALKAFKGTMPALQLDQQQIEKLQKRTREIERSRVQLEEEAEVLFPESRPRSGGGMF